MLRPLLLTGLALLIPVIPFVLFGDRLETAIAAWLDPPPQQGLLFAATAGLLASDILLPVPSSTIMTAAGAALGVWLGTAAGWLGTTMGAAIGFALARWAGRPLAQRWSSPDDLQRLESLSRQVGPWMLVVLRAVPVLAEASVLVLGAAGLGWKRFLPPVAAANLGLALAYAAFGQWAHRYQLLPAALAISIALPVLILTIMRRLATKN